MAEHRTNYSACPHMAHEHEQRTDKKEVIGRGPPHPMHNIAEAIKEGGKDWLWSPNRATFPAYDSIHFVSYFASKSYPCLEWHNRILTLSISNIKEGQIRQLHVLREIR